MNFGTRVVVASGKQISSCSCERPVQQQGEEEHLLVEFEQAWKGALALNNAAVALFARGCFEQGKGLLRQAVDMIRFCSLPEPDMYFAKTVISEQIRKVPRRIAQFSILTQVMPLCPCIRVLENSTGADFPIALQDGNAMLFSFVRMETSFGFSATMKDAAQVKVDLEVHSATILYNMGVLKICQEMHTSHCKQRIFDFSDKTKLAAIHFFQATHTLLARSGILCTGFPDSPAIINLFALRFLALLLSGLPGREQDASNATKILQETQHLFDFATSLLSGGGMYSSMAAAA